MEIQILSDLHLESPSAYDVFEIPASAPCLALLGDIGNTRDDGLFDFLTTTLHQFRTVFFLLGNHEPYHSSWKDAKAKILKYKGESDKKRLEDDPSIGEFIFLDQTRFDLSPTTTILGCPLYSFITPEQADHVSFGLNDFFHIKDWTIEDHNRAHASDLAWLNTQVRDIKNQEPDRQIIIFTHHAPSSDVRITDPKHSRSPISSGFTSDLSQQDCF